MEIDPISGLPKELGVMEDISKEKQEIVVTKESRRFGKVYTIIKGINTSEIDIDALLKSLKKKFACGGTFKKGVIELQGDHRREAKPFLVKKGFPEDSITIK